MQKKGENMARMTYQEGKEYLESRKGIYGSKIETTDDEVYRYVAYMNNEF